MNSSIFILHSDDERVIFSVPSSEGEPHTVTYDFTDGWLCTCTGCLKGGHFCRHMYQAKKYMEFVFSALLGDDHTVYEGGLSAE